MVRMVKEEKWVHQVLMDYVDQLEFEENLDQMVVRDLME